MTLPLALFQSIIDSRNTRIIAALDGAICGCRYVHHWVFNMDCGMFRPLINELDFELKDIHTTEQLYSFLTSKQHDLQEHTAGA